MTARILVGVYPGEFGYEKAAFHRACLGEAHLRDLPLPLIMEIMRCVGDLRSFLRFFQQTSKTLKDFLEAEQHQSLWTCIAEAKVDCTRDYKIKDPRVALLQRCASGLKSLEICPVDDYSFSPSTSLSEVLTEMKALQSVTCNAEQEKTRGHFPTLPTGEGILPCLETLNLPYALIKSEDQQEWKETFPKLQSLTINIANLWPFGEDLKGLFYPPRGRLRVLHVMSSEDDDYHDVIVDLQILNILGGSEEPPPLPTSLVEEIVSDDHNVHEALYAAINRGLLPRLREIEFHQMRNGYRAVMVDLFTRQLSPQLEVVRLRELFDGKVGEYSSKGLKPEAFMGLVGRLPLREISMRCFPMHEECTVISSAMALAFACTIQQNNALRVLELSEGGFATLARGIKESVGLTPAGEILINVEQLEELIVGRAGETEDTDRLSCDKVNEPIALQAPCLHRLWLARREQRYSVPLFYRQTPQLREVDLSYPDMYEMCVFDALATATPPLAASGSNALRLVLEAPHLSSLHLNCAYKMQDLHVQSASLRTLRISGVGQPPKVYLDTPMLDYLTLESSAKVKNFSLRSHLITHLTCGTKILARAAHNRDVDFTRGSLGAFNWEAKLSSLDVCCPILRSLEFGQVDSMRSFIVEHREPPAQNVPPSSMACLFGEVYGYSNSLESILFKGITPAAMSSSPSSVTVAKSKSHSAPYRAPLLHLRIGQANTRLKSVKIKSGWALAPEAKRTLAYFALEFPHVQVFPKLTAAAAVPQAAEAKR